MNIVRTIEQERSKFAYECVKEVKEDSEVKSEEYKSLVKDFPMMILKNGLLQSIVFLESKGKTHHRKLLEHLSKYLSGHSPLKTTIPYERAEFSAFLARQDVSFYRNITNDILAFLNWLRRYVDAMIA